MENRFDSKLNQEQEKMIMKYLELAVSNKQHVNTSDLTKVAEIVHTVTVEGYNINGNMVEEILILSKKPWSKRSLELISDKADAVVHGRVKNISERRFGQLQDKLRELI